MTVASPVVLISSAGRRVGLVRAFQETVHAYGGRVIATDSRPGLSAACQVADAYVEVPSINNPGFLDATLQAARAHSASLIIPTLDTELEALASVRDAWQSLGVHVSVPSPDLVRQCRDKRLTARLFEQLEISPIREEWRSFPRFIKPISGSLSKDVHVVRSNDELPTRLKDQNRFIHQELVDTSLYREYTVDALFSASGRLVCAAPRRRIEVRGGEISKGRTEKGPLLSELRPHIDEIEGARGCLTIQIFYSPSAVDRRIIGIEVNARFGGGYPMSHAAGAGFPQALVDEVCFGRVSDYREDWTDLMVFLRFDDHVCIQG